MARKAKRKAPSAQPAAPQLVATQEESLDDVVYECDFCEASFDDPELCDAHEQSFHPQRAE